MFLHRVWGRERVGYRSWAIGHALTALEQRAVARARDRELRSSARRVPGSSRETRRRGAGRLSTDGSLSPYRGLTPFEDLDLDVRFFFGRERERSPDRGQPDWSRLTVLYGETGVGNSLVLRAGVAHHLRGVAQRPTWSRTASPAWRCRLRRVARRPGPGAPYRRRPGRDAGAGRIARPPRRSVRSPRYSGSGNVLDGDIYVVLDQTEEYFLYHPGHDPPDLRRRVPSRRQHPRSSGELPARDPRGRARQARRVQGPDPNVLGNYLRLEHLDDALPGPRSSSRFAPTTSWSRPTRASRSSLSLSTRCSSRSSRGRSRSGSPAAERRRGRRRCPDRDGVPPARHVPAWDEEAAPARASLETLSRLGGAEQIVRDHVDEALTGLTAEEKDIAARMFDHLVTPSGAKIAHEVGDLAEYAGTTEGDLLPVLVEARKRAHPPLGLR